MSLTDFRATAIRDGLTGGVWREVWLGLTGQVEPVVVESIDQSFSRINEVSYAGISMLKQLLSSIGVSVMIFEIIWTIHPLGWGLTGSWIGCGVDSAPAGYLIQALLDGDIYPSLGDPRVHWSADLAAYVRTTFWLDGIGA